MTISVSLSCSVKAANERMPETVYPPSVSSNLACESFVLKYHMSEYVFVGVRAIETITLAQQLL